MVQGQNYKLYIFFLFSFVIYFMYKPFNHLDKKKLRHKAKSFSFATGVSCVKVGPPIPCNNIKLVDIPDMEYFSAHGQVGECFFPVHD